MAMTEDINIVAIAIDKDKNSQSAVKWAVENFLKSKKAKVVLVHVKTHNNAQSQTQSAGPIITWSSQEPELQHLFLPYRGFCARKGYDAEEVVLHDLDVSSALVSYVETNSIGTIVVGASARSAIMKRFKQPDVPTNLAKLAPEFCSVYVIAKGKVQSVRSSIASTTSSNSMQSNEGIKSSYFTSNSVSSSSSNSSNNSRASLGRPESTHVSANAPALDSPPAPDSIANSLDYYTARLQNLLGQHSNQPSNSGSSFDNPRGSCSRDSWRSAEGEQFPWNDEVLRLPSRPPSRFMPTVDSYSSTSTSSSASSEHSVYQSSFATSSSYSSHPASYTTESELDTEIRKLKLDVQKTMDLYRSICDQATTAKQQADDILRPDKPHTIEDFKRAKQVGLLVADLERLRNSTASDGAKMSERLAEMESEKRKMVEQRVKAKEEDQKSAINAFSMTHRIYTLQEIEVATDYFSASLQIGEGGYGPVYRGVLQHTPVAIKVLRPDVSKGLEQFQKEIDVLGRIRHPNMVLLLGACPEYGCLVYEFMENGSLEDRLFRKNNTPPIPWQARFKIAAEIGTALLFLHQTKPEPMVHRDLKPANILLDSNYNSKIADVGLARLVPQTSANEKTQYHMTAAAGTFCYIDPEYQQSGLLGTKSDVYSLGVVLLQLISAKPPMALAYHMEEAIEMGEFSKMLDPSIPDWPVEEALSMAKLAVQCCELRKKDRPDLGSVLLPELVRLANFGMNSL